jgi:hypothetical protein
MPGTPKEERMMKPIYAAAAALVVVAGLAVAAPPVRDAVQSGRAMIEVAESATGHKGSRMGWTRYTEGWLAFLKVELKITDEQEPQWEALAEALRQSATRMERLREERPARPTEGDERPPVPAVERLDHWERFAAGALESVRSVNAAFKALYGVMSEDQRKLADELASHRHRHRNWR